MTDDQEYTTHERGAIVAYALFSGKTLTTTEVSSMLGVSQSAAYKILCSVSRVIPGVVDEKIADHVRDDPELLARGHNPGSFSPRRWRMYTFDD